MDSKNSPPATNQAKCCDCGCSCSMMNRSFSGTYLRSVKRKHEEFEEFKIPGFVVPQNARVEIGNECEALRETVKIQQQAIQDLITELDEERNAASSAANEAMSMIVRLQREKAEIQMEARQFKRFAEEKMAHDQQETMILEDLMYKREETIQSLTCEVQAYKHRMMSYGLTEMEAEGMNNMSRNNSMSDKLEGQFEFPNYEIYPPLRCNSRAYQEITDDEAADIEKYASGETPRDQLKDLEYRINQLEKSPRTIQPDSAKNVLEKVIVGHSPRRGRHIRKFSTDSMNYSPFGKEIGQDFATDSPRFGTSVKKTVFSHVEEKTDNGSEIGDDMSDRVYMIDSIHQGASLKASVAINDDYMTTPRDHSDIKDFEVQKLYARLHALEADRESMRQAIISMGTDKAQLVLLKEIAQNLYKDMSPARSVPVKKQSLLGSFSFMSLVKCITSFVFWRRKSHRSRYMFGLSPHNAGLLMLLDRGQRLGHWKRISPART